MEAQCSNCDVSYYGIHLQALGDLDGVKSLELGTSRIVSFEMFQFVPEFGVQGRKDNDISTGGFNLNLNLFWTLPANGAFRFLIGGGISGKIDILRYEKVIDRITKDLSTSWSYSAATGFTIHPGSRKGSTEPGVFQLLLKYDFKNMEGGIAVNVPIYIPKDLNWVPHF